MKLLGVPAAALSLAGRHGTLVAAASIFVGLAIPGSLRPASLTWAKPSWSC